uniref:Uncharacterized protein n=1 Tax=Strongyloides venezuelensis TaxID=75913 RepID=A0A0K0FC82_STRVS
MKRANISSTLITFICVIIGMILLTTPTEAQWGRFGARGGFNGGYGGWNRGWNGGYGGYGRGWGGGNGFGNYGVRANTGLGFGFG